MSLAMLAEGFSSDSGLGALIELAWLLPAADNIKYLCHAVLHRG
jgi:hypothetical protein